MLSASYPVPDHDDLLAKLQSENRSSAAKKAQIAQKAGGSMEAARTVLSGKPLAASVSLCVFCAFLRRFGFGVQV